MPSGRVQRALEALADLKVPKDIQIAPGGQQVVYTLESFSRSEKYAISSLWVADIGVDHSARQLTAGFFKDEKPQWSPDGKYIAFLSDRAGKGRESAIYLLPLRMLGGEPYAITETARNQRIRSFEWSPDGSHIAFISEETGEDSADTAGPRVFSTEATNLPYLRVVEVERNRVRTLVAGDAQVDNFSWSPDSTQLVYSVSETRNRSQIYITTLHSGHQRKFIDFPGQIQSIVWALPDILYFIGRAAPPYVSPSVYEARITKKQWGSWFGWDGDAVDLHRSTNCVVARIQNAASHSAHALGDRDMAWPFHNFFSSEQEITSFDSFRLPSSNDFTVVVSRSSPETAHEVWSVLRKGDGSSGYGYVKLSSHNSAVDGFRARRISTTASDGWLFTPKLVTSAGRIPTVILTYGHETQQTQTQSTLRSFAVGHHLDAAQLTTAGYAVLCPSHRHGSGYAERYAEIIAILRKAVSEKLVDESRITISGWGEGGFLSSLAVIRNEFTFQAAICGGGVVDWNFAAANSDARWPEPDIADGALWDLDVEPERRLGVTSYPGTVRKAVKTPILVLHGEQDEQVPVSQAIGFWRERQRWNGPVEMVLYPREKHVIRDRRHLLDLWTRVIGLHDKYLK